MDKKKRTLIIGGSAGAAVLVALIVVSIALANRPSALIVRGIVNTISDAERIELFDVTDDVANGGSIAVSANLDKIARDDLSVEAKLYSDVQNQKGAYEMTVAEDNEEILRTKVLYDQDRFVFTAPDLVDGSYGVNFKDLAKNLPGSIFDPDEETDYSLNDEQYNYFLNLRETTRNNKNLDRDISNTAEKYRQLFIEKLVRHSDTGRATKTITAGGEKILCTVITLTADQDSVALAVQDMIDYANNDKDLEKLLYRVASNGAYYEDTEDFIDQFYDMLDDMEDSLDELQDQDIELKIDFYITSSGRRIAQVDAELEVNDEDLEISLVLGKNVAKSKEISLTAKNKRSGESFSAVYTVKEDSSKLYQAEFEIRNVSRSYRYTDTDRSDDLKTDKYVIKVEWDRKNGDFKFDYRDKWDERYIVKGNLLQKGDRYVFVLTNLRAGDEAVPNIKFMEVTVTVDRHDPAPNIPGRYTEITKMDKREFKHFVEDIRDGFEDLRDEYFG